MTCYDIDIVTFKVYFQIAAYSTLPEYYMYVDSDY